MGNEEARYRNRKENEFGLPEEFDDQTNNCNTFTQLPNGVSIPSTYNYSGYYSGYPPQHQHYMNEISNENINQNNESNESVDEKVDENDG